jgi:hypothetical protein
VRSGCRFGLPLTYINGIITETLVYKEGVLLNIYISDGLRHNKVDLVAIEVILNLLCQNISIHETLHNLFDTR